ncbi:aspartate--tRNA ligase [Patescibacteria group bacterium]|nr:aspartate--tRNA ligase [Patescibacteria group bacterium]MBU4116014.1 aspartate--tRNA ligase [Patescibacteria group bacterium]
MNRIYIKDLKKHIDSEVVLAGWVNVRRDHGKLIFIDLRDKSGIVQMVALPNHESAHKIANTVRNEWVLEISGLVNKRPEKMVNKDQENGDIEIEIKEIKILNEAETPAFEINSDGKDINEEIRMKYRYLDLRRDRMQKNIRNRHNVIKSIRDFFDKEGFIEIETPILTKSTPEGARDFVVPSRTQNGKFYALPQAPQQYKQLLMASGMEKYFQIARCMRDEDSRGDRQPEFTQMDLEMSFVEKKDVMNINEKALIEVIQKNYPKKKIQEIPFPRLTYKEAMEKYKKDSPDLRKNADDSNLLAFCWIIDFPFFEKDEKSKKWTFTHNPFSAPKNEFYDDLMNKKNIGEILTDQYDIVLNGNEIGGGSIRNHRPEALRKVFEIMGHKEEDIEKNFGHMMRTFSSGTPPHGGIAWGIDRLMMLLQNELSIREVIAFPKTGDGRDLLMDSPAEISKTQLDELGIEIKKTRTKNAN